MSETAITTAIITIACVICACMLINAIYPAMHRATSSVVSTSEELGERIKTSVNIIAESNESTYEYVWVKNTGASQIAPSEIERSDIFFGETGNFHRFSYDPDLAPAPCWNYSIENDNNGNGRWDSGETVKITINSSSEIAPGDYYFKIVLYNGVSDEDTFSI
ncbi:MAG: hypothetical protein ACXQTW_02210 [Candidatus Methanospirareceae archaeon]